MTFTEFQNLARKHAIGALEPSEFEPFNRGRVIFGQAAEEFVQECSHLASAMALSLAPIAPSPKTKHRLMKRAKSSRYANSSVLARKIWMHN